MEKWATRHQFKVSTDMDTIYTDMIQPIHFVPTQFYIDQHSNKILHQILTTAIPAPLLNKVLIRNNHRVKLLNSDPRTLLITEIFSSTAMS